MHPAPDAFLADAFGVLDLPRAQARPHADVLAALVDGTALAHRSSGGAAKGLLDALHDEFVRAVRDPGQLSGRSDWRGFVPPGAAPAPTLDALRAQARRYPLLRDILQPREAIDRTLDRFATLVPPDLLDAHRPDEVLGLFAPELVRTSNAPLPSLTRREHHALSPDSHLRIGRASS